MKPRTLVTGASGFIGTSLCRSLADQQLEYLGIDDNPERMPGAPGDLLRLDVRDYQALEELCRSWKPNVVINLAAVGVLPGDVVGPEDFISVNVGTVAKLSALSAALGFVVVQAGTCFEYAEPPHGPVGEDHRLTDAGDLYRWSKVAAERVVETITRSSSATAVIRARIFGVTGTHEHGSRLLPAIVRAYIEGRPALLSDGTQVRDLLHVRDVAAALLHISTRGDLIGQAVNIGRGEGYSVRDLATKAAAALGSTSVLRFGEVPRRAHEVEYLVADTSRLMSHGWKPGLDIDETIKIAVAELSAETRAT